MNFEEYITRIEDLEEEIKKLKEENKKLKKGLIDILELTEKIIVLLGIKKTKK